MIRSFACKETERIFKREFSKEFPRDLQKIARRKLLMINHAADIHDLRIPPGNRLEKLRGDRNQQYSIRINDQWRICFEWHDGEVHNVEIVDYH